MEKITTNETQLIAINAIDLSGTVPQVIELLPAGNVITGRDGRNWNNSNPQSLVAAFNANKANLPIDIEHATEHKAPKGEPAPAIGWIERVFVKDNGSTWGNVSWNAQGMQLLKDKAYRYLSPVFRYSASTNSILALTSAALTNNPNLFLTALNSVGNSNHSTGDTTMSKAITQALGLTDGASDDNIVSAINALKQDKATALNSAKYPDINLFVPISDHKLALNQAKVANDELAQIKQDAHSGAVETAINAALEAGKIAPASVDYHTASCASEAGLKAFNAYVAEAPVIVSDSGLEGKQVGDEATALNAAEKEAAKLTGMSEAEYQKIKLNQPEK